MLAFAIGIARGLRDPAPETETPPPPAREAPFAAPAPAPEPEPEAAPATAEAAPAPEAAGSEERAELRADLAAALAEHWPDRKLSSDELDAAALALLRLRDAQRVLATTPRTPENAERLREAREAVGAASADFEYLVDVDPARFLATVSGGALR